LRDSRASRLAIVVAAPRGGQTGVIGTNKGDAHETVNCLLADADSLQRAPERDPGAILRFLEQRRARVVNWEGWKAIDAAEMALGATQGRTRTKIAQLELMLEAASADAGHP
jgi:ferredoxin/flavodoxin---NADP+ reductase